MLHGTWLQLDNLDGGQFIRCQISCLTEKTKQIMKYFSHHPMHSIVILFTELAVIRLTLAIEKLFFLIRLLTRI